MEERERREDRPGSDSKKPAPSSSGTTQITEERAPSSSSTSQITEDESGANRDGEEEDLAAKLDVTSCNFDPLLALYSPTVSLPYPNIKPFNNVAAYESFLKGGRGRAKPENVEKKRRKAMKGVVDPERIERLKKLMVNNVEGGEGSSGTARPRRRQQKPAKNVLTRMPLHTGSPLGQLHRCVEERRRVKVHIRTFKGLRGVCSGFIVAFDKFWNMAMVDVDETYREPLLGEAFYHEKALTVTRLFEKLRLQGSPEEGEGGRRNTNEGKTRASQPKPDPPTADSKDSRRGEVRREPRLSRGPPESTEPRPPVKAPGAGTSQGPQPYGRVHTRHINQLFIRGESVLLVNLLPL